MLLSKGSFLLPFYLRFKKKVAFFAKMPIILAFFCLLFYLMEKNMSRKCEICGKKPLFGHNVSHSNNRTQKIQNPNIQKVKIVENGTVKTVTVCSRCLRSGKVQKAV